AILDAFLKRDPHARVACETLATHGKILVAGEFRTKDPSHFAEVHGEAEAIVRDTLRRTGYGSPSLDIDPDTCDVEVRFNRQSGEIAGGVDGSERLGAGDQGMMFGYATDETPSLMPLPWMLATSLVARATGLRAEGTFGLRPDGKAQVTVRYEAGRPVGVEAVVLSWQHEPGIGLDGVR